VNNLSAIETRFLEAIREHKPKEKLMEILGIKGETTLMRRLQTLQQKTGEVYLLAGLISDNEVRFSGPSIIIHNSKLMNSPFASGDLFTLSTTNREIILTKK